MASRLTDPRGQPRQGFDPVVLFVDGPSRRPAAEGGETSCLVLGMTSQNTSTPLLFVPFVPENPARRAEAKFVFELRPAVGTRTPTRQAPASILDRRPTPKLDENPLLQTAFPCVSGHDQARAKSRPPENAACPVWSLSRQGENFTQRRAPHLVVAAGIAHLEHEEQAILVHPLDNTQKAREGEEGRQSRRAGTPRTPELIWGSGVHSKIDEGGGEVPENLLDLCCPLGIFQKLAACSRARMYVHYSTNIQFATQCYIV